MNEEGWCETCNSWNMTSLDHDLVRCPECWSLNPVGEDCWCGDVPYPKQSNEMTYECGNCGYASEEPYCPQCIEEANIKKAEPPKSNVEPIGPTKLNRCDRCYTITSLTDECPRCRSKVLLPIDADAGDPLLWATQFNRYDHKQPKMSLDTRSMNDVEGV